MEKSKSAFILMIVLFNFAILCYAYPNFSTIPYFVKFVEGLDTGTACAMIMWLIIS